jgi:hypothetical protein
VAPGDDLRTKIEERERGVERLRDMLDEGVVDPANRAETLDTVATNARWLGDLYALDGRPAPATEWFGEAARYGLRRVRESQRPDGDAGESEPQQAIDLLHCAVLSGEARLVTEATAAVRAMDDGLPDRNPAVAPWYHYATGLAAYVAGDDAAAADHLSALASPPAAAPGEFANVFAALTGVLDGFVDADGEGLTAAVDALVADLSASEDDPHHVRVPATALVRLADERGVAVSVDSPHVHEALRP